LLVDIPREELITETDARRALQLSSSSLSSTSTIFSSDATDDDDDDDDGAVVLALYLAHLLKGISPVTTSSSSSSSNRNKINENNKMNKGRQAYLQILPRNFDFHPATWNDTYLGQTLGESSLTRQRVNVLRRDLEREYHSLPSSPTIINIADLSYADYLVARLNVLTRSFGSGDEHALVPILDLYDHRGRPNVSYRYHATATTTTGSTTNGGYQIRAARPLQAGEMLYDSYGKRTDSVLFAKYGFVNRDGDDWMDASLAIYHNLFAHHSAQQQQQQQQEHPPAKQQPIRSQQQSLSLLKYLQFDDGYDHCVYPDNNTADWAIKQQKWHDLVAIATVERRWVVRHPARSELVSKGLDAQGVFDTCAIITRTTTTTTTTIRTSTTTTTDHENENQDRNNNNKSDQAAAVTVRTALCVVRLADLARQRLTSSSTTTTTATTTAIADVVQSELETLQAVRIAALRSIQGLDRRQANMRTEPCPPEAVIPLLMKDW
jgi:SET domain